TPRRCLVSEGVCSGRPGSGPWRTERKTVSCPGARRSGDVLTGVPGGGAWSRTRALPVGSLRFPQPTHRRCEVTVHAGLLVRRLWGGAWAPSEQLKSGVVFPQVLAQLGSLMGIVVFVDVLAWCWRDVESRS